MTLHDYLIRKFSSGLDGTDDSMQTVTEAVDALLDADPGITGEEDVTEYLRSREQA